MRSQVASQVAAIIYNVLMAETLHPILMLFCKNLMFLALKSVILMQFHPIAWVKMDAG